MSQTWENCKKLVSTPFGPNLDFFFFFSKIWLRQSLDIMISYHHVKYQKKSNDPILRKLSDGTDGQTEKGDFIGHCPTNVKRPTDSAVVHHMVVQLQQPII